MDERVKRLIGEIYADRMDRTALNGLVERVMDVVERYRPAVTAQREHFSAAAGFPLTAEDAVLISYGDSLRGPEGDGGSGGDGTGEPPLRYLYRFLDEVCDSAVSGVHILPFSPYSSDDGFSVIDYREVNPELGSWEDIEEIAREFRLMADLVLNHCSARGPWFQAFLRGEAPYDRYFITADPAEDLSMVVRPRSLPLLTEFETAGGTRHVWTTFSADQVDLNWENPEVLLEMIDIFLSYLAHGAQIVRLDAIAYLWKEIGHSCLHHPHTHRMVKLFRRIMELVDPSGILITETNVPHKENLSYFGESGQGDKGEVNDEAHMVYNFSLPPLLLDAVLRSDAGHLQEWAAGLDDPGPSASFFNFCASHDGIGLLPTHGILSDEERDGMIGKVKERGGRISWKATATGEIPYEMNINYLSAFTDPALPEGQRAETFLAGQAVMLAMAGVPGIYIHSLVGSENWQEGVELTGANRSINREKLDYLSLVEELEREGSLRNLVFQGYLALLEARGASPAFHPKSPQRVEKSDSRLFVLFRGPFEEESGGEARPRAVAAEGGVASAEGGAFGMDGEVAAEGVAAGPGAGGWDAVLAIHNLSADIVEFRGRKDHYPWREDGVLRDLVSGDIVFPTSEGALFSLELEPYEVMWLSFRREGLM
jgi:glucosylglycerate phosphorylase